GAALAGAAALAIDAFCIEPAWVQVTRHDLPLPGLPEEWEGARVVHLTDLHYRAPRSEALLDWMGRQGNNLRPDPVAITGHVCQTGTEEVAACARYRGRLPRRQGVVAVLGDHDFYRRRKRPLECVVATLSAARVRVLRNAAVELPGGLRVAGVDPCTRWIEYD